MIRLILILLLSSHSMAGLKFPSDRLKVMDIETLQRIVATNINGAQRALVQSSDINNSDEFSTGEDQNQYTRDEGAKLIHESLELIFARPEQNRATSAIYSSVEGVASEYGGVYPFLARIVDDAISTLDKSGKEKALLRDQNTYVYILNNMMGEIRPLVKTKEGAKYRKLVERIRDEDIDFSDALKSYRILNSMSNIANPSKVAEQIVGEKQCSWWEFLWC